MRVRVASAVGSATVSRVAESAVMTRSQSERACRASLARRGLQGSPPALRPHRSGPGDPLSVLIRRRPVLRGSTVSAMRWPRVMAASLAGIALAVAVVIGTLLVAHPASQRTSLTFVGLSAGGLCIVVLGVLVTWRVRHNPVGPLLTWFGMTVVLIAAARPVYYQLWLDDPGAVPLNTKAVAVLDESGWWLFGSVTLLLLLFPDGHLPSRRWRWVPSAVFAACAITQAGGAFSREPFLRPMQDLARPWPAVPPAFEALTAVATLALVVLGVMCGLSLVLRFRRATGVVRAQLKWLPLAGLAAVAYPIVCLTEIAITGDTGNIAVAVGIVALVGLPVAVSIAMLRHDLYDVDRVLADSISYLI